MGYKHVDWMHSEEPKTNYYPWYRALGFRPPEANPRGVKTYLDLIRWKRLEAPKPYVDKEGYFEAPWLWLCTRRVVPGLVPAPTCGIKPLPMHEHINTLKLLLGIKTDAVDSISAI